MNKGKNGGRKGRVNCISPISKCRTSGFYLGVSIQEEASVCSGCLSGPKVTCIKCRYVYIERGEVVVDGEKAEGE